MFDWSLAVSYFVLGRRMGCLDIGNTPEDCQEFIDAIDGFLVASHDLLFNLPFYKLYRTKLWKKLEHYQMRSFEIATKFIEEKIKDLNENFELSSDLSDDVPVNVDFLTYMLLGKQMSIQETSINAIDLLGAGVDTTSYTLGWSLYALATNTEVQSKLREEVNRVTKDDNVITPEHIHNMPYLRHTIREAQRFWVVL
jgi:cytochrome P450 family 27 subfamily C